MATFGERLRTLMAERGIGLRALARAAPCDPGHLSRVSRDLKQPGEALAERLDEVLDAGGDLVALVPLPAAERAGDGVVDPDDAERLCLAQARPSRTDPAVVESLAAILAGQRRLEDAAGSAAVLPAVRAQLAGIEGMVAGARGDVRPVLLDVAAQWSQFSGWLHTSVGDYGAATGALTRTLQWATEIGDGHMVGSVMSWQGYIAERRGQVAAMVGLSQAGQRVARGTPDRVTALFQEARARARLGEAEQVGRLTEAAAAEAREAVPARPWEYYYDRHEIFGLEHGLIYRILGRADPAHNYAAIDRLTAGLDVLPPDMRASEWAGEFLYQLALAYRQAGEHAEVARIAGEMEQIAARTESARLAVLLGKLRR